MSCTFLIINLVFSRHLSEPEADGDIHYHLKFSITANKAADNMCLSHYYSRPNS